MFYNVFMLKEFKKFLVRGNVVDLAVGVVIGAAFNTLVNSLVSDLFTPLLSFVVRIPDFSDLFFVLNDSKFQVGHFINAFLSFLIVSFAIFFFVVKPVNILVSRVKKEDLKNDKKKCKECLSDIPKEAKRCAFCASIVE